jgi:hypothetical protein
MPKTLFIVDDDVFRGLPEAVQKKLLDEVRKLFSFIPGFTVEARTPPRFPATIHFTDSVVMLVEHDDEVDVAVRQIRRQEDANTRFSIRQTRVNIRLDSLNLSFDGDPDKEGQGGHSKTVVSDGGRNVSITMTFGVASLESAEQEVLNEDLHGRSLADILKEREKQIHKMGAGCTGALPCDVVGAARYFSKRQGLTSAREEIEAELLTKHTPLKDWPNGLRDQVDHVATALARLVAHEARHQYLGEHSASGLGADSARIWGDKNFEDFDGRDKANINKRIHELDTSWNSATVHLELCPQGQSSPFE